MNALLEKLDRDKALGEIAGGVARASDLAVAMPDAARGAFLATIAARHQAETSAPLLAITPTANAAERLALDAKLFLPRGGVELFPAWETLPFEHVSPSTETIGQRIRVMWRLGNESRSLRLVVAPIRAALQRVDPRLGKIEPLLIEAGGSIDLDSTIEILAGWGYERTYQVEAHGEMAVRGGILDLWPAGDSAPIRIELWGDEIEEVRRFSLADQRSTAQIKGKVLVFPGRELLPTDQTRARAEELLRSTGGNRSTWERLAEGLFFPGMESWLPWLVSDAVPVTHLLPKASVVAICDPKSSLDRAEMLRDEEVQLARVLLETWSSGSEAEGDSDADALPRLFAEASDLLPEGGPATIRVVSTPEGPSTPTLEAKPWEFGPEGGAAIARQCGSLASKGWSVIVSAADSAASKRIGESFKTEGIPISDVGLLNGIESLAPGISIGESSYGEGFKYAPAKFAIVTTADLQGRSRIGPMGTSRAGARRRKSGTDFYADLSPGDHVVHYQHGIGRFAGMVSQTMSGVERDYLLVEYAGDDKLYVPTDQLDAIRKYSGGEKPRLSRLGGSDWAKATGRARREAAQIAERLVELYRDRITVEGHAFAEDTPWQHEMEADFPFALTPDQSQAVDDVKTDMESAQPMERLICGDVGYGKTEVAVRAAFKAVQDGCQVAVLVPTTLLAQQHFTTFSERFAPFPVRVEMLSRFLNRADAKKITAELAEGTVDLVVGTHRLLQDDITIPKLGLLVVDEEQRFGVTHKEAIKQLRRNVDVLTLSATPIPRTLEMSLTGIRDMTPIDTPPEDRRPVITYVGEYDEGAAAAAIRRELLRDGQVFYVHNRVRSIDRALAHVRELAPGARVAAAHGQMTEAQLEKTMLAFYAGEFDVLVTTTIVESGLDIHSVNTLIVDRADMLGLAQLYQLRGRVGRGRDRAYAYLFYPARRQLSEEAYERLKTIGEHTDLGSGFAIARRDLEIRGAGNILGEAQSGHIPAVGFDLYCQLVAEAVAERRGRPIEKHETVKIELPVDAHIPDSYISQESLRLEAYRRLAGVTTLEGVDDVRAEWIDRYGPLPKEAETLFDVAMARAECVRVGVREAVFARGKIKIAPLDLKASQQVRLARISRDAIYKAELGQIVAPLEAGPESARGLVELLRRLVPPEGSGDPKPKKRRARSSGRTSA